jgi:predicted RNA-binding protein with PUA-like domain
MRSETPAMTKSKKAPPAKTSATPSRREGDRLYWLFKSEPDVFSWDMLKAKGRAGEEWSGVRNYQARNNMRAMRTGDLGFFYHSNIGLEIVGICQVSALAHPDSTSDDPRWECVDVTAVCDLPKPVALAAVKANPRLAKMSLVTSMRLSVQPVTTGEWAEVCRMGALDAAALAAR